MYTIKEFRSSMRKILDEVDEKGSVSIKRFDKTYIVLSDVPKAATATELDILKTAKLQTSKPLKKVLAEDKPITCKHNNILGFCKFADCNARARGGSN